MFYSKLVRAAAILATAVSLISFAGAKGAKPDPGTPVVFSCGSAVLIPGQTVTIEIDLSQVATQDQVVSISSLTPGNWSSLPSQVVIPAGQSSVKVSAQVSLLAVGLLDGCATCNGGSAAMDVLLLGGQ